MSEIRGSSSPRAAGNTGSRASWLAAGGILGAIAAMSCCILPLTLFSLGITGAWIGRLTALSPYQPIFIVATVGCLGYGYWLVHRSRKADCSAGEACERRLNRRIVNGALWTATALVGLAIAWPLVVPLLLG
jgi:mercuric ion transport protein